MPVFRKNKIRFCKKITTKVEEMNIMIGQGMSRGEPEFSSFGEEGRLAMDIFETDESIFVVAPIAGVDEKSIEITITEDILSIRGIRPWPASLAKKPRFHAEECYWGLFARSILLPTAINSRDIIARLEKDILFIEIPKARKATSKIIPLFQKQ